VVSTCNQMEPVRDGYTGRARRVVDDDRGYLLGVIFVGPGVEELINSAILVRGRLRSDQLALARRPMFSHPSAKPGSACSRPTGPELGTRRPSLPRRSRMFIPNGPWCLPLVNRHATQGSLRACAWLSQLDDVNAL
jgi:hypothetical protein